MNDAIKKWAPVYDSAQRPTEAVTLDDLADVGIVFNAYGIATKEVLNFDKEPIIIKQAPRREGQRPTYLISCKRNGNKSWFNPTFVLRQDANLNPVYPKWSALGGAKAVVEALIKLGKLVGGKEFEVQMTDFNRDGSFKEIAVRDAAGNVVLNDDGTPKMVRSTTGRNFPELVDPSGIQEAQAE